MYCSVVQSDEPWPNWENEDGIHRLKMGSNDFWNNFMFLKYRNSSKKYAPNWIPVISCTRRCQTKQLGPSRVDILSKIHKLYTDRKNVTDFLYLVLHLAHKVTYTPVRNVCPGWPVYGGKYLYSRGQEWGREGVTLTSISVFDSYNMKTLWFKFGHDIFSGFKMPRL